MCGAILRFDDHHGSLVCALIRFNRTTHPSKERLKLVVSKQRATDAPLDLSTRGLWKRRSRHEKDCVHVNVVLGSNRRADRLYDLRSIANGRITVFKLLGDRQFFFIVDDDGKRRAIFGTQCGMGTLRSPFNVLRKMIYSVEYNDVLEPASDEELPVVHEPQVTGAQIRSLLRRQDVRPEGVQRFTRSPPIPFRNGRVSDPNLANLIRSTACATLWRDDGNFSVAIGPPTTYEFSR